MSTGSQQDSVMEIGHRVENIRVSFLNKAPSTLATMVRKRRIGDYSRRSHFGDYSTRLYGCACMFVRLFYWGMCVSILFIFLFAATVIADAHVGHPRTAWLRTIDDDFQSLNFGVHTAWRKARDWRDRDVWHEVVCTATLQPGVRQ